MINSRCHGKPLFRAFHNTVHNRSGGALLRNVDEVHIVDIGVAAERQAVDEVGYILRSYRRRLVGGFQGVLVAP